MYLTFEDKGERKMAARILCPALPSYLVLTVTTCNSDWAHPLKNLRPENLQVSFQL